jgi:hypothetical protein
LLAGEGKREDKDMDAGYALERLEHQELIRKLVEHGHGPLVDALLLNENEAYTKGGRLNKSGARRLLGWTSGQLEAALAECRGLLAPHLEVG